MVRYFTNVGPAKGPILYRDWSLLGAIGVLQAHDNHSSIGMAPGTGWDDQGASSGGSSCGTRSSSRDCGLWSNREFIPT